MRYRDRQCGRRCGYRRRAGRYARGRNLWRPIDPKIVGPRLEKDVVTEIKAQVPALLSIAEMLPANQS